MKCHRGRLQSSIRSALRIQCEIFAKHGNITFSTIDYGFCERSRMLPSEPVRRRNAAAQLPCPTTKVPTYVALSELRAPTGIRVTLILLGRDA
jgi:hypothetical protein